MRISWYEGENFPEAWKGKLQINSCLKLQSYASRNMESIYSHVFFNVLNYTPPPPLLVNSGVMFHRTVGNSGKMPAYLSSGIIYIY